MPWRSKVWFVTRCPFNHGQSAVSAPSAVTPELITPEEEVRTLKLLAGLTKAILSAETLNGALQAVVDTARDLTAASYAGYFINQHEGRDEMWELVALTGAPKEDFVRLGKPRVTPIFRQTFDGEIVCSDDVTVDPRYGVMGRTPNGHPGVRSYLAVPVIQSAGTVHGAILLAHGAVGHFGKRCIRLLENVSAKAGFALERFEHVKLLHAEIEERKRIEAQQHLLLAELTHRVKNTLTTVQSLANQTLIGAKDIPSFRESFIGRLHALAATHSILVQSNWVGVTLAEVVRAELQPYHGESTKRWEVYGPVLNLTPSAAINAGLVIHELTTNAVKYGALSEFGGHVAVTWDIPVIDGREFVRLMWQERGGQPVTKPTRKGFGSRLFRQIAAQFGGTVTVDYEPEGVRATLQIPTETIKRG